MKRLPKPEIDALQTFDRIAEAKYKGREPRLQALRSVLEGLYRDYEQHAPALELLSPASNSQIDAKAREDLLHCYNSPTAPAKEMMAKILSLVTRCPLCSINEASTLDHYLPQAMYAQYAVFPLNLVPSCFNCNNARNTKWKDDDERALVHMYFDDVEAVERSLTARIKPVQDDGYLAEFEVIDRPGSFSGLYKRHLDSLDLTTRFARASRDMLRKIQEEIRSLVSSPSAWTRQGIGAHYARMARDLATSFGANNWEVAVYQAVSGDDVFIDSSIARARSFSPVGGP